MFRGVMPACFVAGTQVVVGIEVQNDDGSKSTITARELALHGGGCVATMQRIVGVVTVPIESLREGDWIISRDQHDPDGPLVAARISRKYRRVARHLQHVSIVDAGGREQTLHTTEEHPFHVAGEGWTDAGDLPGDGKGDILISGTQ